MKSSSTEMSIMPTLMPDLQRDVVDRERLARAGWQRRCASWPGVDADAEPGHAVAAADADQAEEQHDDDLVGLERRSARSRPP